VRQSGWITEVKPKTDANNNIYYEEWWAVGGAWQQIGSTAVDLSGYVKHTDLVPITNEEIDAIFA
jgi:hypothetical protein